MKDTRFTSPKLENKKIREQARYSNSRILKRRRKRNYILYYILLLFFVVISSITLSVTVFFNINDIVISGIYNYQSQDIVNASEIKNGDNLFRININDIKGNILNKLHYIDKVEIKKVLPDKIKIDIVESSPVFFVKKSENEYIHISDIGRIIETSSNSIVDNGILVKGLDLENAFIGEFLFNRDNETVKILKTLYSEIKLLEIGKITEINIDNIYDLKIMFDDKIQLVIGDMKDISYKLELSFYIIENKLGQNEKGTIDVRDSKKAIFRPS